jgi:2-C-methyl-D-erythritol 4-phosphate cytidylyltransferase/2-C-methyl-D-erythritol 2,4-cyclodiphosphate synthase
VEGGATRDASVRAALEALAGRGVTRVLIHDGARPLLSQALTRRLLDALEHAPGAAPALPVTDALWRGAAGRVAGTQDRAGLWRAQTPQAFRFEPILAAHRAHPGGALDDVEVARAAGLDVAIVEGDEDNLKLTYPGDFARAERLLAARKATMDIRTGNGFDVHRFGPGDHVWLCGVSVPHPRGLQGHSDADVGMHALTDAIYGALCEGDIGQHFPPSDMRWKGAASRIFLEHAMMRVAARGFRLTHADVTLICEWPKIGPHTGAMRAALAGVMGVDMERISVKATTSERLGFTGREGGHRRPGHRHTGAVMTRWLSIFFGAGLLRPGARHLGVGRGHRAGSGHRPLPGLSDVGHRHGRGHGTGLLGLRTGAARPPRRGSVGNRDRRGGGPVDRAAVSRRGLLVARGRGLGHRGLSGLDRGFRILPPVRHLETLAGGPRRPAARRGGRDAGRSLGRSLRGAGHDGCGGRGAWVLM